jgi:hypothetical protein
MDIDDIRNRVLGGRCLISFTHTEKLRRRRISIEAIEEAIRTGAIVEDYPHDPRGPSCLIHGIAHEGRPMHVVCGITGDDEILIVTAYEPSIEEWESDWRTRKKGGAR